jgi:hypothetical protein
MGRSNDRWSLLRSGRGARFCAAAPRAMRGLPEAAVACLGAGGGVLSPGTKSKMGRILSRTWLRSASCLPSGRGIHVPVACQTCHMRLSSDLECVHTLIFSIPALYFFMNALLNFTLENTGPARLVVVRDFQDMGSVDPVVGSASHAVVTFAVELVDWDLQDG